MNSSLEYDSHGIKIYPPLLTSLTHELKTGTSSIHQPHRDTLTFLLYMKLLSIPLLLSKDIFKKRQNLLTLHAFTCNANRSRWHDMATPKESQSKVAPQLKTPKGTQDWIGADVA